MPVRLKLMKVRIFFKILDQKKKKLEKKKKKKKKKKKIDSTNQNIYIKLYYIHINQKKNNT